MLLYLLVKKANTDGWYCLCLTIGASDICDLEKELDGLKARTAREDDIIFS